MRTRMRRPSPAMVVAMVALFSALGGYATAATAVPLAKRALLADNAKKALVAENAKKLGGQSPAQLVQAASAKAENAATAAVQEAALAAAALPGPASTIAGLVTIKTVSWSIAPGEDADVTVPCDVGQKAISGGWEDPAGWGHSWDSRPAPDGAGWRTWITVGSGAPGQQVGTVYAICVK